MTPFISWFLTINILFLIMRGMLFKKKTQCAWAHSSVWRSIDDCGRPSLNLVLFETAFLWFSTEYPRLADPELLEIPCLCLLSLHGSTVVTESLHPARTRLLEIWTQGFLLALKHFNHCAISPPLGNWLFMSRRTGWLECIQRNFIGSHLSYRRPRFLHLHAVCILNIVRCHQNSGRIWKSVLA